MYNNIVVLSGGFDPVHEGHIAMFREARQKYDRVIVGVNSDQWLARKKGKPFMPIKSRKAVLKAISYIDSVVEFRDTDNTAIDLLRQVKHTFPGALITFGNGGDRSNSNYPEFSYCMTNKILINDKLGGLDKQNSSSSMLDNWATTTQERPWGYWRVLYEYKDNKTKIKELVVNPNCYLSWQKHIYRGEIWFVKSGTATLYKSLDNGNIVMHTVRQSEYASIKPLEWHTVKNNDAKPLVIVEIQYGDKCIEDDIIRSEFCI